MNKLIASVLIASIASFGAYKYNDSTIAAVTIAGGIIKAQHTDVFKKYKRKDCPICKGTGWYISGDKITKVDCGYCEAEKSSPAVPELPAPPGIKVIVHPPAILKQNCPNGNCNNPQIRTR